MQARRAVVAASVALVALLCASSSELAAETLDSALAKAYQGNPQLNAQRALVRATDENVPAGALWVSAESCGNCSPRRRAKFITEQSPLPNGKFVTSLKAAQKFATYSYGATASQTLFNGLQTANRTRTAESQVMAAREGLRVLEQNVLLNAATIYMDVLRDSGNVEIQQSNVTALRQVLEQTNKRFSRGDVTANRCCAGKDAVGGGRIGALGEHNTHWHTAKGQYEAIIGVPPRDPAASYPG